MQTDRYSTRKTRLRVQHVLPLGRSLMLMVTSTLLTLCPGTVLADLQWETSFSDLISRLTDAGEFPAASLHLLPCGNVSEQILTGLLRRLPCPRGCTLTSRCDPCREQLISSLYQPLGGALLLWADSAECLQVPEDRVPSFWVGASVLLLPPEDLACSDALSLPIFAKTPFPLCAEHNDNVWRVRRRVTFTTTGEKVREIANLTSGIFTITSPGLAQTEDLRAVTLRVRFLNYYPYVYCTNFSANDTCPSPLSRPETSIISALGAHLNFSTELRQHPQRVWGSRDVNGTWHGLLASVVGDEADIAIGGMSVTPLRASAVEFLREFTIVRSMFVSRKPPPLPAYLTILAPLTPSLWAILVSTLLLGWCCVDDAKKMPL